MHDLVVLEDGQDKILGIDFIRHHALSYNALPNKCFWETHQIDSGNLLANFFIDAQRSWKIKLTGHNGTRKCKERLIEYFFWLNMNKDIVKHSKECPKCHAKRATNPWR